MRNRRNVSLIVMLILAFGMLAGTIAAGNKPELGLDLQGGASVVLQPPAGTPKGTINQAIEIIRNRVDALGVAEPQISRQGSAVVVELPGVKNQDKALALVGTTAELRFRPVLGALAPEGATTTTSKATTTTTTAKPGETATPATTTTSTTSTTAPKNTTRADNKADAQVILPDKDEANGRYALGPAGAVGKAISTARASVTPAGEWIVELEMTSDGIKAFNTVAGECYSKAATCPTGQLAIELDGVVQSAPTIQAASFKRDQIQISGSFKEREAKDLALVLRYGSLPVQLKQQTVRTVSASLGKDSLHAGLVAGIIGTALVLLYMLLYYRILGLVVIAGLTIWFSLQWSIISYLGVHNGLALSLSGVTGIVVSVGVTVDSYVVYFERLKDELHAGRTMRSAIDSAFKHSFRTVLVADTSAFLAAAILYFLTVGSVRGFAFFLGLSTILDVVVAYFFKRPLVALLGRWGLLQKSKFVGLRAPVAETVRPGLGGSAS
ncbi:MAG: protein-export rane protein SecD/SecF family [Actinomycetia bacterium]|nr:protein-export rane protein SecD/SecF family [Actinomycetes bacterium]